MKAPCTNVVYATVLDDKFLNVTTIMAPTVITMEFMTRLFHTLRTESDPVETFQLMISFLAGVTGIILCR